MDADDVLGGGERQALREAAGSARARTGVRVLPLCVACSSRYERSGDLLGVFLALLAALALLPAYPPSGPPLYVLLSAQFAAYLAGAWGLSRIDALRYAIAGRALMSQRANAAAAAALAHCSAAPAGEPNGGTVLLYLSLFERQAVVLADDAAAKRLPPDGCAQLRDVLLHNLREASGGREAAALGAAIARCSEMLQRVPAPVAAGKGAA